MDVVWFQKQYDRSSPKSQTVDVLAAQPGEALLGQVLQVVGALVIDHHGQYKPRLHTIHVLCKATTLILTTICVKPVGVKGGYKRERGRNKIIIVSSIHPKTKTGQKTHFEKHSACKTNVFSSKLVTYWRFVRPLAVTLFGRSKHVLNVVKYTKTLA